MEPILWSEARRKHKKSNTSHQAMGDTSSISCFCMSKASMNVLDSPSDKTRAISSRVMVPVCEMSNFLKTYNSKAITQRGVHDLAFKELQKSTWSPQILQETRWLYHFVSYHRSPNLFCPDYSETSKQRSSAHKPLQIPRAGYDSWFQTLLCGKFL